MLIIKRSFFVRNDLRHPYSRAALCCLGLLLPLTATLGGFSVSAQQLGVTWQAAPSEQQIDSLSLEQAILRAFARNPQIAQAAAQIRIGASELKLAESAWMPQLALNGGVGRQNQSDTPGTRGRTTSAGVSLTQLIYDFGKTGGSIDEQHHLSDAYRYQLYSIMTSVGQQTLLAYLQVKRYQTLSASAERHITSLDAVKAIAQMRAEAGLNSQSDVLQAETRIAGTIATLEQYRAQQRSALAQLTVLTGVVPVRLPDLPQALLQQEITLQALPYEQSALVRSAQSRQEAARQRIRQAEAKHWPSISVQAARARNDTRNRAYWDDQVRLLVEAPLYQGGAVSAQIDAAQNAREAAQAEVEAAKLDINQRAATSYADMIGAQQRQAASERQLTSANYTRDVYRDEYRLSKRSLNDLLSVEQDVLQAENARATAQFDGWDATVNYAAAVDNLLDMLGIERQQASGDRLPSL